MADSEQERSVDPSRLMAAIEAAPCGPQVAAFFDFDGTVIHGFSVHVFNKDALRRRDFDPVVLAQTLAMGLRGITTEADFDRVFDLSIKALAGRAEDEMTELGERLFAQEIAGLLYPEAWDLIQAHRARGHTIVLASSATRFQIEPTARALGISEVLCTPIEVVDGILTGRPGGPKLWRAGKARAVHGFAAEHGIDLDASFAYSNGDEDVPFLETVGHPTALNPQPELARVAAERGWPTCRFADRGRPGVTQVVRTGLAMGAMVAGFAGGAALGLINGSRRSGVDLGLEMSSTLVLALAGIELNVVGQANAWERRPAVFIFNHRSALDPVILARVIGGNFVGVSKIELAANPLLGPMARYMGTAFVDRADPARAIAALQPVVDKLREGRSVIMSPEGTRTFTPQLNPFKKGAFRTAMQAGVPVVPVVIRNAGELMWKNARTARRGTLDVAVLPPIDVSDWTVADLPDRIAEVRALYERTLDRWPESEADLAALL
jgi:HAD superfamily hydrolase (TIGR01490 family)